MSSRSLLHPRIPSWGSIPLELWWQLYVLAMYPCRHLRRSQCRSCHHDRFHICYRMRGPSVPKYKVTYFVMVQLGREVSRPQLILLRASIPLSMNSLCRVSLLLSELCPLDQVLDQVLELSMLIMVSVRFGKLPRPSTSFRLTFSPTFSTTTPSPGTPSTPSPSCSVSRSKARWSVLIASGISWWPIWRTSNICTSLVVWSAARRSWRRSAISISLSTEFWSEWIEANAGIICDSGRSWAGRTCASWKRRRAFALVVVKCPTVSDWWLGVGVWMPSIDVLESGEGSDGWTFVIASRRTLASTCLRFSVSWTCLSIRIWTEIYQGSWVTQLFCPCSEELTPNNPSASRKELSQAAISRKISFRLRYRFRNGRWTCFIKKWWTASNDLGTRSQQLASIDTLYSAYPSSFCIGAASSSPRTSPVSKISWRTEMRMSAHRCVKRKHPRRFICGASWHDVKGWRL